jgi:uncharacterized protein (DUF433 family)
MATVIPELIQSVPLIERDDTLYITGTRVPMDTVITAFLDGATLEEIVYQYPSLQLADVYAVIGYYLHHRPEIDVYRSARAQGAAAIRHANESRFLPHGIRARLLARGAKQG